MTINFFQKLINSFSTKAINPNSNITAKDRKHLENLIRKEIDENGYECDLNHIDVSQIKDFSKLFGSLIVKGIFHKDYITQTDISKFNGNISKWDTSQAETMLGMFWGSKFNGDISNWNVSNVKNLQAMFVESEFNGDISKWDTSNVENMKSLFAVSIFDGDISNWDVSKVKNMANIFDESAFSGNISEWLPYNLENLNDAFKCSNLEIPYWGKFENKEQRTLAIDNYLLKKELDKDLSQNIAATQRKMKI